MKSLLLSTLLVSSVMVNAGESMNGKTMLSFKAMDNSLASQYCVAAATKGLEEVKRMSEKDESSFFELKRTISCNGLSLVSFSKKYTNLASDSYTNETSETRQVKILANDDARESKLCVEALNIGEQAAREKYNMLRTPILCNNKSLEKFVEEYKNKQLIVQLTDLHSSVE